MCINSIMYLWTMFAFSYFNRCGSFCAGMNPGVGDAGAASASSGTRAAASSGTRSPVEASAVPPSTRWMPPGPPPGPPPSKAMPKEIAKASAVSGASAAVSYTHLTLPTKRIV